MRDRTRAQWAATVAGACGVFGAWVITRPDRAGPQWNDGGAWLHWIAAQGVVAVAIGLVSRRPTMAIAGGCVLQVLHFAFLGEHYDDTLWSIGFLVQIVFAAITLGIAWVVQLLTRWRSGTAGVSN